MGKTFNSLKNMSIVIALPKTVNVILCVDFLNYKLCRALYSDQRVSVNVLKGITEYEQRIVNDIVEDILVHTHMLPVGLEIDVQHYAREDVIINIRRNDGY